MWAGQTCGWTVCNCCVARYRKVAADRCQGGALVEKYRAVKATCPVIKPAGLDIEVIHSVIQVNRNVTFNLTQEQVTYFLFCMRTFFVYFQGQQKITEVTEAMIFGNSLEYHDFCQMP